MPTTFLNLSLILLVVLLTWLAYKYFELHEIVAPYQKRYKHLLSGIASMVDRIEGYNVRHSAEVAKICERLGIAAGLNLMQLQTLKTAAMLHDVGEILLPADVLNPEKPLDPEELFLIRAHPLLGELHLKKDNDICDEVPAIIRWHHERWDDLGYPDNLKGEEIPKSARILALADAISAMSNNRPYRKHQYSCREEILFELESHAGLQFDPELVRLWGKLIRKDLAEEIAEKLKQDDEEVEA